MSKKGKTTLSEMAGEEPSSFGRREASPAVLPNVYKLARGMPSMLQNPRTSKRAMQHFSHAILNMSCSLNCSKGAGLRTPAFIHIPIG